MLQGEYDEWLAEFHFDSLEIDGHEYSLSEDDVKPLYQYGSNYWLAGPSTWMTVAILEVARRKYPEAREKAHLLLTATALGIEFRDVVRKIRWHEGYMTFHDGGECRVLEGDYD